MRAQLQDSDHKPQVLKNRAEAELPVRKRKKLLYKQESELLPIGKLNSQYTVCLPLCFGPSEKVLDTEADLNG